MKDGGERNGRRNANNRGERQHETNHDTGEVAAKQGVNNDENMLIGQLLVAQINASGQEPDEHVEIEEEGGPCCGLMLRDRGDDGDVNLGVSRVPQGVESTTPGSNETSTGSNDKANEANTKDTSSKDPQEGLELPAGNR